MKQTHLQTVDTILEWLESNEEAFQECVRELIEAGVTYPEKALRRLSEDVKDRIAAGE